MGAEGNNRAEELLKVVFTKQRDEMELTDQAVTVFERSESPTDDQQFGQPLLHFYNDVVTSSDLSKVDCYLQGTDPFPSRKVNDPQFLLDWWKAHASKYPVLSNLAQDYLATPAASAAPERSFSVAGQVCTAEQGGLLPRMIEMTVSSQLWILENIPLAGDFSEVGKVIKYAKKFIQKKTRKSHFKD